MKDSALDFSDGSSDSMEVVAFHGTLRFTINEPWAGDTERGFGATTSYTLSEPDARKLLAFLQEVLYVPSPGHT